ncbi:MAG: LTA synthase family protein, partial [Proteobacteria bacterium]|nr:LTA synthase family protein [Pseudomonadota bacterium]
ILLPEKIFSSRWHRQVSALFFFIALYGLLFTGVAEWVFWDEFGARFNFIAVDYLVYTTEVVGNIYESYPLPTILGSLLLAAAVLFYLVRRSGWLNIWFASKTPTRSRIAWGSAIFLLPVIFTLALNNRMVPAFANNYNQELTKNGHYSLFAAFRENQLDFRKFYRTENDGEAFRQVRELIKTDNSLFLSPDEENITRLVKNKGIEKHYNVIQITVESLSADYLAAFGNNPDLTPNLDDLARRGILFTNLYATGTRTDRGMEALTLSVPPTPGRSIIKRPDNEHLFSLGSVFQERGYDTAFIYGGYGYFDNMNYFFGNNGYRVIDRASMPKEAVTFANVWGACDGDLYNWVLQEADRAYAADKPFYHFIMTTSNHRPFTYPDGRIDIPSHTGRRGAVKYTDYAIGEFIRKASAKPWFANTVFVIVADHCAGSAGETDLPVSNYRIPLIIYNPQLFQPAKVDKLCSQIDYAPTLLALLHWTYESQFYGKNVFAMQPDEERAFIGNYQKLGYLRGKELTILKPLQQVASYDWNPRTSNLAPIPEDSPMAWQAIAYYQSASYIFAHHHRMDEKELNFAKIAHLRP